MLLLLLCHVFPFTFPVCITVALINKFQEEPTQKEEEIVLERSARLKVETKPNALGMSIKFENRVTHKFVEEKKN